MQQWKEVEGFLPQTIIILYYLEDHMEWSEGSNIGHY